MRRCHGIVFDIGPWQLLLLPLVRVLGLHYAGPCILRRCHRLTDLSSVLSDGEPIGAFGYGLAGRGGRQRIFPSATWRRPPALRRGQRSLISGLRREATASLVAPSSRRRRACDLQPMARRDLRQDDGLTRVMEFPGPLVPLAAFFAKSRDPVCRSLRKRLVPAVMEKQVAPSSSASCMFSQAFPMEMLAVVYFAFL